MKTGLVFLSVGVILIFYAYWAYRKADCNLSKTKEEDLVSYYLDLALKLYPGALWSALLGIFFTIIALVIIVINLPLIF
ncbi:hypothetical protein [Syntrophomonas erecta]